MADVTVRVIRTEEDYRYNLKRIEEIFNAEPDTPEGDEAEVVTLLIMAYEEEHYPIEPATYEEVYEYLVDQHAPNKPPQHVLNIIAKQYARYPVTTQKRKTRMGLRLLARWAQKLGFYD